MFSPRSEMPCTPYAWPTVEQVLSGAACEVSEKSGFDAGIPFETSELSGGLTNRNYRLTSASGPSVVVRLTSPQSTVLTIDRDDEYANAVSAAEAGVAPRMVARQAALNASVIQWIDGRTLAPEDLDDSQMLVRLSRACRNLHQRARFGNEFNMFAVQRSYLEIVLSRGYRLPDRYLEFEPQVRQMEAALSSGRPVRAACHNDLLAANILDDGQRLWFIDFEYSGTNDPAFDLGNLWSEASLPVARLEELVAAYLGFSSASLVARARLFGLLAKYGWMLWASIQDATSDVAFDFWSWGMEKYERAMAEFENPDFEHLLALAPTPMDEMGATAPGFSGLFERRSAGSNT